MSIKCSLKDIFLTFLKVGAILLGGGYVILPILQSEVVEKRNWITEEELVEYYAISQSLPGLIAINISIFIGYKIKGKFGALAAVTGLTFSAFWAIVCMSSILATMTNNSYVKGALWGVEIAVLVLIISAVREMWGKAIKDSAGFIFYLIALGIMLFSKISPAYIIIASIFVGIIYKSLTRKRGEK
ncbi:MAG: chromate transporter [Candidatus Gastranaerophilales bacterium]|nr:chromate transporter [Candidatus Gastranaerophilales bacterium]